MKVYYYVVKFRDGTLVGAYTPEEMKLLVADGKIAPDDFAIKAKGLAYNELPKLGDKRWKRVQDVLSQGSIPTETLFSSLEPGSDTRLLTALSLLAVLDGSLTKTLFPPWGPRYITLLFICLPLMILIQLGFNFDVTIPTPAGRVESPEKVEERFEMLIGAGMWLAFGLFLRSANASHSRDKIMAATGKASPAHERVASGAPPAIESYDDKARFHVFNKSNGKYMGHFSCREMAKGISDGRLQKDFVAAMASGRSHDELAQAGDAKWVPVAELLAAFPRDSVPELMIFICDGAARLSGIVGVVVGGCLAIVGHWGFGLALIAAAFLFAYLVKRNARKMQW